MSSVEIVVKKPRMMKSHYEFWLNNKEVATFDKTGTWSSNALFRVNDQKWTLKSSGFWKKTVELSAEQSPYTKIRVPFNWSYKFSISPNTRDTYKIRSKGFWKRRWVWEDAQQNEVIELKSNAFSYKNRGAIIVHQPITNDLLLLAVLGWYVVMSYEEVSATAG